MEQEFYTRGKYLADLAKNQGMRSIYPKAIFEDGSNAEFDDHDNTGTTDAGNLAKFDDPDGSDKDPYHNPSESNLAEFHDPDDSDKDPIIILVNQILLNLMILMTVIKTLIIILVNQMTV
ncbi:uncharacterized protein LOC111054053 [Nilaparvata lugens]|uniref:uncharacterized protein LOC111054053 n=1 Tax=Nilaparvata lugens TaxID=108931 RepID=UPI00193E07A5|nr:uncharacterized protein LOC111054053 [Nilaparvata lugens]